MKKTLAIVLALVMVLAMIPAMSAHTGSYNLELTAKEFDLKVYSADDYAVLGSAELANTVTAKYDFEEEEAVATGKWTDDKKMAIVEVVGFAFDADDVTSVKIDNKELDVDAYAAYLKANTIGAFDGQVNFPVELTKAGYSDTFVIVVESTKETTDDEGKTYEVNITETAKISVKMVNTHAYKGAETATITNIAATKGAVSAYIVGDKIYLDYVNEKGEAELKLTFADENGKAFSAITYAYQPTVTNAICLAEDDTEVKLDKSAALYYVNGETTTDTQFKLETKAANYITKKYDIVVRQYIQEEDPKGIYFAETTKTIAMGETYTPVVLGVKTGKPVAADIIIPSRTDAEVIDVEKNVVIGTREGVAFITASYKPNCFGENEKPYKAASMKIVVTLPGESIPEVDPSAEIYYVTCRALNVRAGAGTSYKKVDLIHRGDAVKVVELKNGWAKLDDGTYVCAKYIAK